MSNLIYLDHAATTPLAPRALDAMIPYLTEAYGNPTAAHSLGRSSKRALEDARARVAAALGASPSEIYFTSGGTESNNWALKIAGAMQQTRGQHIITTPIEHHSVLKPLKHLSEQGFSISHLAVDASGNLSTDSVRAAIRPDTVLISVMAANNEIGTLLPIAEIGKVAQEAGVLFHSDAVQAGGHIPLDLATMPIDLLSLSAHKFGGPKGVGVLFVRRSCNLEPYLHGGSHERGKRAGTQNVAGAVGLATALEDAVSHLEESQQRIAALRDRLIAGVLAIPGAYLTGDPVHRLPGCASFVFDGVEGEALVLLLDQAGICASAGSSCASGSVEPSHVLTALGLPHALVQNSLRLSLGEATTSCDVDKVLDVLPDLIDRVRRITAPQS